MTPREVVDYLTLVNYCYNRRLFSDLTPERLEKVYGPSVWDMEAQFQAEQATIVEERAP